MGIHFSDTATINALAGAAIAQYLRCKLDTNGAFQLAAANERMDGVALTGVASGEPLAVATHTKEGTLLMVANGAISVGAIAYAAASGKVGSTGTMPEGIVRGTASTADGDIIEVEPFNAPATHNDLLYSSVAASTAITNTTTATNFDTNYSIPANDLVAGDVIRIRGQGIATATNSTDTLGIKLMVGSVEVMAITAVDVADNDIFVFDCDVTIRTIGASGTCVAAGFGGIGAAATATAKAQFKASQTMDTTAAQVVAAKATWSVASASNSCRLDSFTVQRIRK